jgi:hypothetical protein
MCSWGRGNSGVCPDPRLNRIGTPLTEGWPFFCTIHRGNPRQSWNRHPHASLRVIPGIEGATPIAAVIGAVTGQGYFPGHRAGWKLLNREVLDRQEVRLLSVCAVPGAKAPTKASGRESSARRAWTRTGLSGAGAADFFDPAQGQAGGCGQFPRRDALGQPSRIRSHRSASVLSK